MRKIALTALIVLFAFVIFAVPSAFARVERPNFDKSYFTIKRADDAKLVFKAEVARTAEEQAYGLMFMRSLAEDSGMIFVYDRPRTVAFWMKNTHIPLDMLFVAPDKKILKIAAETRPFDLTPISSKGDVLAVVEIKGGMAKKLGIKEGDLVDSDVLTKSP